MNEIILQIKATSSRNQKEAILKANAHNEYFKRLMHFIYNPYIRTGISKAKLKKAVVLDNLDNEIGLPVDYVIDYYEKNQTGSNFDANFGKTFIEQFEGTDKEIAEAIVTKNLKIGITAKTLNKVYGKDFIPMIGIMSAEKYKEQKHKVKGPYIASEKLDGARRLLIKENGLVSLYSRTGIVDEGLYQIEEEAAHLPDNAVYDGELLAVGSFANAIELRQATNAIANRKGKRDGLTFNVFDFIALADFKAGKSKHPAKLRKALVAAMFGDEGIKHITDKTGLLRHRIQYEFEHIKAVPIMGIVTTEEEVEAMVTPIWQSGFEGLMLNTFDGLYEVDKRVKTILKVKNVEEHVLKVIDMEEGTNKNKGKVGALIVEYKGNRVGVGSGLTDAQREQWWNDRSIIGQDIEIDCFGESKNLQGGVSLNCPIFKRIAK